MEMTVFDYEQNQINMRPEDMNNQTLNENEYIYSHQPDPISQR